MPLYIHLSIHFLLAVLVGYLCGSVFKQVRLGVVVGIMGGFLIDLDHVLEYFLVFGSTLNLQYFFESRQFLISEKIRLYFHAWEYAPILLLLAWIFKSKERLKLIFITLAFSGSIHLISDVFINQFYFRYYSLSYRYQQDFFSSRLLSTEQYQLDLDYKKKLGI